jgi:formate dehydrogenase subunit delta
MDVHHLVDMANQIGKFYCVEPDRSQALLDTANHLRRYWDPRMREALYTHIDQHAGIGLDPFVAETIRVHRTLIEPARGKTPSTR